MAEKEKIEAESYNQVAFGGSLKARSRGLWAGAALGLAFGLAIGLAAPLIPAVAGLFIESIGAAATIQSAISVIPASMAIFGASAMATGAIIGAAIGESSGAASSMAKEMETRELKRESIRGKTSRIKNVAMPVPRQKGPEENQRYFNPKVGAVFTALGAVAGAVMAAGFLAGGGAVGSAAVPALGAVLGPALSTNAAAVTSYFVGVMALGGSLFGVNFPKITNATQDFMGKLLSGESLGTSWEKEKGNFVEHSTKQIAQPAIKPANPQLPGEEASKDAAGFAAKLGRRQVNSYREMIIKPANESQELYRV